MSQLGRKFKPHTKHRFSPILTPKSATNHFNRVFYFRLLPSVGGPNQPDLAKMPILSSQTPANPVALLDSSEPPDPGGGFVPQFKPMNYIVAVEPTTDSEQLNEPKTDSGLPPGMTRLNFIFIFVGLALAVFMAALDQTIVSISIPSIVTDFQSVSGITWIGIAYFLTGIPFIPTYGKLSDILGRKHAYSVAIGLFELGSLICGLAPSMVVLIIGRAVAGLGGGAILSLALIIIADFVRIEKRGLFAGIIGTCFAVASVVGPLLGGYFTEHLTWRVSFFINLPIGLVTIVVILVFMKIPRKPSDETVLSRLKKLDWIGTAILVAGVVCVMIGITTGGTDYAWDSALIISFLTVGGVLLVVFAVWEARGVENGVLPKEFYVKRFVGFFVLVRAELDRS
jgi:MFS family permease